MKIAVIFPYNNIFSSQRTKPVVLAGLPYIINSDKKITVISRYTETPIQHDSLLLTPKGINKKKNYYKEVLILVKTLNVDLIEVHQDLKLAAFLGKNTGKKVALIKHGPYLINRFRESFYLYNKLVEFRYLKYITSIYCISNYVLSELRKKYQNHQSKFILAYNTYGHINLSPINYNDKQDIICYAGKPTTYKGFFQILPIINRILHENPSYKIVFMLPFFNNSKKQQFKLDLLLNQMFLQHIESNRLEIHYNLSNHDVFKMLVKSKILLVPTMKQEPFGLIALEGYLAGCIVISTQDAGLKEIGEEGGIYFNNIKSNSQNYKLITGVINSYDLISDYTKKTRDQVLDKFNPIKNVKILDNHREFLNK